MKTITLSNGRVIGDFLPPFMAAEIGINHNGDLDLAREMIRAAAAAGACSVKFQNYRTEDFIQDRKLTHAYISKGVEMVESQYEMFKRCELSTSSLKELRLEADRCGLIFFTTPTSEETIQAAIEAGALLLKNGSDYLGNLPLIQAMARSGLPTVLSTGMSCLSDIEDAVAAFHTAGGKDLVLLHCISSYPAPAKDVNLRKIPSLRESFGLPVGFSDHTDGLAAAVGSVAFGACMIEKHFTTDRDLPGPDQRFSSDPAEFGALCRAAKEAQLSLGSGILQPSPDEWENRRAWRLSCLAAGSMASGDIVRRDDLIFGRPGHGYPPKSADELVGRTLKAGVDAGHVFIREDFL